MKTRMGLIKQSIAEYLQQLDRMDRQETPSSPRGTARLKERIATLKGEMQRLEGLKAQMESSPEGQVSLTDPDARSMVSQGKGTGIVGYNVQTAVETKHHLIVAHVDELPAILIVDRLVAGGRYPGLEELATLAGIRPTRTCVEPTEQIKELIALGGSSMPAWLRQPRTIPCFASSPRGMTSHCESP